jgi:hypothetical protein
MRKGFQDRAEGVSECSGARERRKFDGLGGLRRYKRAVGRSRVLFCSVHHRFCSDLKESYVSVALLLCIVYLPSSLDPVPIPSISLSLCTPYLWKKRHGRVLYTPP